MGKILCEICNQTFKNEDGLLQHKSAKHSASIESKTEKNIPWGKIIAGMIAIIALFGIYSMFASAPSCKTADVTDINIGGHKNLLLHIHAELEILIDGKKQFIPANVGISKDIMRPLHTHDASGEIHIEGPCARNFKLTEFFNVWGKQLNNKCLFDKCTDKGKLEFSVNGISINDIESYYMKDHDGIKIEYTSFNSG